MKIGVCNMSIGDDYKRWTKNSRLNKIEYCKKHNYEFIEEDSCYDDSKYIPWSKINLILKYLDSYDYLVWIDSDILIMNDDIRLEDLIVDESDIICGSDWKMINTGVLFVKNSDFSKQFLKDVYNNTDYDPAGGGVHVKYGNWEQGSFIHLYDNNHLESQAKIRITYPTVMNSYWYNYYPGDLLLHWAGVRGAGLEDVLNSHCPNRKEDDTDETFATRIEYLKKNLRQDFDRILNHSKQVENAV